jgi:hypothetical protein
VVLRLNRRTHSDDDTGMIGCYDRVHPASTSTSPHGGRLARFNSAPATSILTASLRTIARFGVRAQASPSPRLAPLVHSDGRCPQSHLPHERLRVRIDANKAHHGHRPQRRLPAASSSTRAPYPRQRYGPSRNSLAGGLHQPAADAPGQPQQTPPAARRIRPAPCLRECHEAAAHHGQRSLEAQARDAHVPKQGPGRCRPLRRRHDAGPGQPHAQGEQGEHAAERPPGPAEGGELHHPRRPVAAGAISHPDRRPVYTLLPWPAASLRRRAREGQEAGRQAPGECDAAV